MALVCLVILIILGYLHKRVPTWATVMVMIGAFPALFYISRTEALNNARGTVCRPPNTVRIHFKENKESGVKSSDAQAKSAQPGAKPGNSGNPSASETHRQAAAGPAASPQPPDLGELLGFGPDITSPSDLVALGERNQLFLLFENKDRLVLARAPGCDASSPPRLQSSARTYTIPRDSVDLVNLSLQ